MTLRTSIGALLLAASALAQTTAPEGPDPREIPIPKIRGPLGEMPGVDKLPVRKEMPDVMVMNDGTRVTTPAQWAKRREEIKRTLAYYAVGQMPPAPGNVKGQVLSSEVVLDGSVRYRLVHLTFGPDRKLFLNIGIFTPVSGGPFPAIISQAGTPPGAPVLPRLPQGPNQGKGQDVLMMVGSAGTPPSAAPAPGRGIPEPTAQALAAQRADVFRRGYALVVFNANDCAEDTTLRNADGSWAFRTTRFYPAYPGYDWGILAGWAWGASRIADYLEHDPLIDAKKLIVTGASRNGKSSMVAAAFDERLMGAPVVTGGGGIGAYRFAGPRKSETLDIMEKKYPNWFSPNLHEFWGQREKLPFDEHWFLALAAPRPFIALEGMRDVISLPEAVRQSFLGAQPAYALFGAADRLGVNYANHAHAFTADDWTAMMDFFDKYLRGKPVTRTFDRFPTEQELDAAAAGPTPDRPPAFEVATVKPTPSEAREPAGWFSYPGGRLTITNCTLSQIIQLAFGFDKVQVSGGPAWVEQDEWDIAAKAPADSEAARYFPKSFKSPPAPEALLMLRTLLSERFALKVSQEIRQRPGFALTIGNKPLKLGDAKDQDAFPAVAFGAKDDPDRALWLRGENASMAQLANRIAGLLRVPVVDETGLKGAYDFKVLYADSDSLPVALQDQLGLKMIAKKIPVEYMTIDHAELPSGN
jgi:uncharacterized protein (TIGR03435 family)